MANDFSAQGVIEDGSIEAAAALMPDLGPSYEEQQGLEPQRKQPRDPQSQQWRSPADEQEQPPKPQARRRDQVEQEAEAVDPNAVEDEKDDVAPAHEEMFVVEVEENGKPVKKEFKASEVWEGFQKAQQLTQEFEEFRKNAIAPDQWDESIIQANQVRAQLMQTLQLQRAMMRPERPNPDLLNPESPRYNPELYGRQTIAAQQQMQRVAEMEEQMASLQREQQMQDQALYAARMQREHARTMQIWPELKDQKEAAKVRDELIQHFGKYGVNDAYIAKFDAAAFAIVKDALAYRRGQRARETAVQVVRAKPKLVRSQARDTQSPVNRRSQAAFQRLQQTGSLEDAAASLDGLIS